MGARAATMVLAAGMLIGGCSRWKPARPGREVPPPAQGTSTRPAPSATGPAASAPARAEAPRTSVPYRVIHPPQVVAAGLVQVNDQFITLEQVLHPIRRQLRLAAQGRDESGFRRKALELIRSQTAVQLERTLLYMEADRKLTDEQKRAVEERLNERLRQVIAEMGGSRAHFEQRLRAEGTDLDTWRKDVHRALLVQTYIRSRFGPRISVSRRQMWEYFRAHRDRYRKAERAQMQIIAAPVRSFLSETAPVVGDALAGARRRAREAIEQAARELAAGKDFAEVARRLSRGPKAQDGGVWPMMERGSFRAEAVEQAAFDQGVGQVSKVIETPEGFYIVKTLKRAPGGDVPFEKVQGEIEAELRRREYNRLREEHFRELRSRTTIVTVPDYERLAVDAAVRRYYRSAPGREGG